jgi:hypothetical protein
LPTYDFINQETGDIEEYIFKISEYDDFVENNQHLKRVFTGAPSMVRSNGGIKNDAGWNENLSRIAEANPGTALANKVGGLSTKAVKSRDAASKHGIGNKGTYKIDF